ncbi:carboxylesterase [Penicillium verhagenii]|uniref:carboxylesterase n=1 Tax=Penicillium verhagenii TaxID=1562060 RepID=UPI00254566E7|nr:carboxylesterase [Penicillium verhagenii]KAJ5924523.1 carboxylesterase [Penicillium verhagenii]
MAILKTRNLGEIRGREEDGVSQYLGIQYATLKNRLADAELVEARTGGVLDATIDGPLSLSPLIGCDIELGHVQQTLPKKELQYSDVNCLNLNIAVPSNATPESKLPVLFFIHGGGFFIGGNSWPQYDLTRLMKLSIDKKLPVVVVTVNYRLGAPGFLTSEELRQAGYRSNNGLRDQQVALEWVQRHIQDFGGDPENVTAAGQSAGGASVTYHLHSQKPLFKRAILMAGTSLLLQALPNIAHEENYEKSMAALGLADAPAEERVKALLEMPGEDLVAQLPPGISYAPALDGDLILPGTTYTEIAKQESSFLPGKAWCQDLLIGDNEIDASILGFIAPQLKTQTTKKFLAAIHKVLALHPALAHRILDAYQITEETSDVDAYSSALTFANDISFNAPTLTYACGWPGNAYVYYFNEGNPWDGPWKGRANHILDVIHFFQNLNDSMSPEQVAVGAAFAEDIFKFCHGKAPWSAVASGSIEDGASARIYGPSQKGVTTRVSQQFFGGDTLRRSILFDCGPEVSLDDLAKVFGELLSG